MIEFHDVSMTYQHEYPALHHISLQIRRGEFVMITGPSGAGKTTLIKLISRQILPTAGQVIVGDHNIAKLKPRQIPLFRRRLGVVFQDFRLLYDRTVWENVALALHVLGQRGRKLHQNVQAALEKVGLYSKRNQKPWHLSGGEMQRVVLARAIVHDPQILLADEPTGNLDFATGWEVMQLLERITDSGTTVVCTTHNLTFIERLRRRTVMLEKGELRGERQASDGH